jgi:hypothetical protein
MHDLDRILNANEAEYEFEFSGEAEQSEYEGLSEMEQLELAAELLEVSNEQELENFLGDVFKTIGKGVSNFAKSSTGKALGGIIKSAAKNVLPVLGGAAGGFLGGPLGAKAGSWVADQAGQLMGLELEGLSQEDKQFEVAQQFVKLAGDAATAAAAAHGTASPEAVARKAFIQAAKAHAPGLIREASNGKGGGPGTNVASATTAAGGGHTGRWVRRGTRIVLLGV